MKPYVYINRYDVPYVFTPLDERTILMEGDFKWMRIGWPNVYAVAYKKYLEDGGTLSSTEFEKVVHTYSEDTGEFIYAKYLPYIISDTDRINMIDPSGGPYISVGMPVETVYPSIKEKVIIGIIPYGGDYKLIIE